jgi:hypothetical protein
MNIDQLTKKLESKGYHKEIPNNKNPDAQACADAKCPKCNHQGLNLVVFTHEGVGSYRAFALCPECGNAEEF